MAPTSTPAAKPTYSLGVGPPEDVYSGCVVREVIDDLEDGRPDTIYTTTYNALSYKTRIEYDEDADGSAEQVVVFEYDEAGRLVGGFVDDGDDGTVDSAATHIYDEWGRLVQVESDRDGDGVVDWRVTLEYNPRSDLLEMMVDDGADGVPDRIERYSYDAGGHRVREEDDIDGDGEFDFVEDLTWSGGLLVRTVWESVRHGTKYIKMYSWDDSRRLVRRDEDQDGDGVLDRWAVIDYEEHGWLARIEDYQGHLEGFSVYTYDPVGRLLARRDDYVALGMTAISRFTNNCP